MTHTDYAILTIRFLIDVPITYFLYRQWQLRSKNGSIRKVRRMVTLWVCAFALFLNYQIFFGPFTDGYGLVSIIALLAILGCTINGVIIFERIAREEKYKQS